MQTKQTEKIFSLSQDIIKHKRLYYAGNPIISDIQFDALEDQLRLLDPDHPVLKMVGFENAESVNKKATHKTPMLSLAKTYSLDELEKWIDKHEVTATFKVDGNSLSLIYEKGILVGAKTRGNGKIGELVTDKIRWVADCVPKLSKEIDCEVRGELYCDEKQFARIHKEMLELGLEEPTNQRNIVAGILGRKKYIELSRFFNFFSFEILADENSFFEYEHEKMQFLKELGFRLPPHKLISEKVEVEAFLEEARNHIENGSYGIDGVVFTIDDLKMHEKLGATAHHPRSKLSFKWQGDLAKSQIDKIHWATSRLGVVTPVAIIDPVYLSGANISNVTLHNALMVKEFNLKSGDVIEIVRSGEVIPKLERVVKSTEGVAILPEVCPSCSGTLDFDDVRLICSNNKDCPAQALGRIINWIKCVDIEDLSDKRVQNLIDLGLVSDPSDLYLVTVEDLLTLPSTKEKMANKLYKNINDKKKIPLEKILNGLGIGGMGISSWESLVKKHPTLAAIRNLGIDEIVSIDGFAEKTANNIVNGLKDCSNLIEKLLKVGVVPQESKVQPIDAASLPFNDMVFVITGALSRPRSEIAKSIQAAGGKVTGSVSKNTSVLVTNEKDSGSSKAKKAAQLGIEIWDEEKLYGKINPK